GGSGGAGRAQHGGPHPPRLHLRAGAPREGRLPHPVPRQARAERGPLQGPRAVRRRAGDRAAAHLHRSLQARHHPLRRVADVESAGAQERAINRATDAPGEGPIGLIAGNGRLPFLFAREARSRGHAVICVAHRDEVEPALADEVDTITWVRVGQVRKILRTLRAAGVDRAVMAGGIGHVRALTAARPDLGAFSIISRLRSFRDDALLRAVADYFAQGGVRIEAATSWLQEVMAPAGHVAGPALPVGAQAGLALGWEVAGLLGQADVGQTVVVKGGHVLALEAVEGTDEAILRGGRLGG